jgi:hypothetical protein
MKYILSLIISGAFVVSGFGQTRNVLVGTNNAVIQPTNFWSADASNARTGLGLGTAATNSASTFQPSSTALSNLATGNGGALSNLQATNLVGIIPASNISTVTFTNIGGTLAISSGGTGATNAANARQNLGSTVIGDAVFIATSAAAARTALSLGTAATSSITEFQPANANLTNLATNNAINLTNFPVLLLVTNGSASGLTNFPTSLLTTNGNGSGLTNLAASNIIGTVALASNLSSPLALTNGGTGATNAATARTNLGLGWSALTNTDATNFRNAIGLGATWLTNTNVANFRAAIGLGPTNQITFNQVDANKFFISDATNGGIEFESALVRNITLSNLGFNINGTNSFGASVIRANGTNGFKITAEVDDANIITFPNDSDPVVLNSAFWNYSSVRQSLGLGWSALTNTNAGTSLVSVNTNGEVVSPTNFWAVAPISTTVQYQTNVTGTSTNAATNSRNLFLFSLSPSVSGITNTVTLPTNPATTFEGDRATITHLANSTNAVTAIRQLGAATNLITLNQLDEAVLLMYRNGAWMLADNISYIEPIYFSGTNAAANAAASRTNLGLGTTNNVSFGSAQISSDILISNTTIYWSGAPKYEIETGVFFHAISFDNTTNASESRTNFGLPLPALTNTNNANFRNAIELGTTNNVSFSNVTASGTLTATGTVTATTNLVVNGFVDFSTNHTNSNPVTNNQINDFIEIRVGTNQFWLPVYK